MPKIIFDITFLEPFHFCSFLSFLSFFLNFACLNEKSTWFSSEISFGDFEQIWKYFPDYQMKTNFWRNQLQWMNSNNWTTTNDYLKHEWQQKPTPKDWKWFKYAQNNQKNPRTKECCNGWLFKSKIASSKQQNNSWTVEWLMIAKFIVVEGSHLLPVSKILNIFSKYLLW